MITVDELRTIMQAELAKDRAQRSVEVWGASVEEALRQASIELNMPVHRLEYETVIKGYNGFLGLFFKKEWLLMVYPSVSYAPTKIFSANKFEVDEVSDEAINNKDGDFGIKMAKDGHVYLKVISPLGDGHHATFEQIMNEISGIKNMPAVKTDLIHRILHEESGLWEIIGDFEYHYQADSEISVNISDDDMRASIVLSTPGLGGSTPDEAEIQEAMKNAGIFFGINEEAVSRLERHPVFRTPVMVAEGDPARDGDDTKIKFLFEVDFTKIDEQKKKKEKADKVDYKASADRIQSVRAGEPVAMVISPEQGRPGRTIKGNLLPAKDGNRVDIPLGNNVAFSDDGTQILATADGQALLVKGVVNVETILTVPGDLKNHLNFLGTIVVKGNVEDGYEIIAQGDIHISGTVGRSKLTAGGNIFVDGGINGDKTGDGHDNDAHHLVIKCGKSIWSRFIQNSYVEAGEFVIVSDGILNSDVIALRKVLCKGKRAAVIGGKIRSCEEINAAILGSSSGTPTRLEVGFDPKIKDELNSLIAEREELELKQEEINKTLQNWINAGKGKTLAPDKQKKFDEVKERKTEIDNQVVKITERIKEAMETLRQREVEGKISASQKVNAGVSISIHDAEYEVTNEYMRGVTFYESENLVNTKDYEEITDNITKENLP